MKIVININEEFLKEVSKDLDFDLEEVKEDIKYYFESFEDEYNLREKLELDILNY